MTIIRTDEEYGHVELTLNAYLKKRNITKYQLIQQAGVQPTQLKRYTHNQLQRVDLAVIARICHALDCEVADLLKYIGPTSPV